MLRCVYQWLGVKQLARRELKCQLSVRDTVGWYQVTARGLVQCGKGMCRIIKQLGRIHVNCSVASMHASKRHPWFSDGVACNKRPEMASKTV